MKGDQMDRNYWVFRIDIKNREFINSELMEKDILRQGWGWDEKQNLKVFLMDEGAKRNFPIMNKVKKGDIILVPRINGWENIAIVEATSDWNTGYSFNISEKYKDYGHCFPAKFIKEFSRKNYNVGASLRSTLRTPMRFWNINYCKENVDSIIESESDSISTISSTDRVEELIDEVYLDLNFKEKIYNKFTEHFQASEWEDVLVKILSELYPNYIVEKVGGKTEKKHGTDILIKIPGITSDVIYAIAIQVKDYQDVVSSDVVTQIKKADSYWSSEGLKLIDKIVLITRADKKLNIDLPINSEGVRFIFAEELKELIFNYITKSI